MSAKDIRKELHEHIAAAAAENNTPACSVFAGEELDLELEDGDTATAPSRVRRTLEGAIELGVITDDPLPEMTEDDLYRNLDVFPFVGFIWNSVWAQEDWAHLVKRARTWHDRAEYWMVKEGARKCATLHISPHNYDEIIERIAKDKLVWLPIQRTRNYNGFSHMHFPVGHLDMNSSVYGVLATNMEDALAFREASESKPTDHKTIGELLGFPDCCTDAFNEWWPLYYDPVYQTAQRTEGIKTWKGENYSAIYVTPHISTHQMLRYAGFRITSHFPCSLDCKASVEVGKVWMDVGSKYDPRGLEALIEILKLPGEWSCLHGIAQIETEPFTVTTNSMPTKEKWAIRWEEVRDD